ncbi:MAG: nicotinamide mononucleotide transporter [Ruminococcaceae bacterium]|nr:nicotinamide mononucleotide transporter [Oscillospiraceae bacterium]
MKFKNPFKDLNKFELILWLTSVVVVAFSFLLSPDRDYLTLCASLIGVTALIFVAKGYVIGQILIVVFAAFYGIISIHFKYYGEVITYLGMSAPMAIMSVISWLRHPNKGTREVEVNKMSKWQVALMVILAVIVTVAFYFILGALNTTNMVFSTISVTTSFVAAYMTFMRSPYYAIGYALNDVVLIVLWVLASIENTAYIPMILCFVMFLINDLYGFINWKRMEKRQHNI